MAFSWQVDAAPKLAEWGYPLAQPPLAVGLPPGGGHVIIPHYQSFSAIVQNISRSYRFDSDEALRHSKVNALAIRRDPVVMDALRSRQMPVAQLPWHIECDDNQNTDQNAAIEDFTTLLQRIPNFQRIKMWLLEAEWYGKYGVQPTWEWRYLKGKRFAQIREARPVNGDKLVFRWDGTPGIKVHGAYDGETDVTDAGRVHFLTPAEREQFLIHQFEPEDADFYEPELAGCIHGKGIRDRIYWIWWLKAQVLAIMMEFLERVGAGGLTLFYFEMGNQSSEDEVRKAAEEQFRNNCILFPRYRDGSTGGPGVERIEPSVAGAQLLQTLVTAYFDDLIRHYILGQTLTSQTASTGMGSGVAGLHGDTFDRIIKYDAIDLAETITGQLLKVMQRYSPYAHLPPMRFLFEVDKPNAEEHTAAAKTFYEMGGSIDEDEFRDTLGLPKPASGHSMLAKMSNLSPAATGMAPQGVPQVGAPGPEGVNPAQGGQVDPAQMSAMAAGM